jgi:nicotinamidase-related amidase
MRRLDPKECTIVLVDVQEKLAAAMPESQLAEVTRAATVLLEAAALLGVPVIATEQYPEGLGPTIPALAERLTTLNAPRIPKLDFSACDEPAFQRAWSERRTPTAIVLGIETHVCVFQTVRELAARGIATHVPLDGTASRLADHRAVGLDLCRSVGGIVTTTETVVFDWLKRAGSDDFRRLSKLIR